jgi:hypothetical protein
MGLATVGTSFVPLFGRTTPDANNRSDTIEGLARPLPETPAARRVATAVDPGLPISAEVAARIEAAARRAVTERLPRR